MILDEPNIREERLHPLVVETRRRLTPSPASPLCLDAILSVARGDDPDELFETVVSVCLVPERADVGTIDRVNRIAGPTPFETRRIYGVAILSALLAAADDTDRD